MKYCCVLLPFPPTSNGLYDGGSRGRYKNARYVAWENDAVRVLAKQSFVHFTKPVQITISYGRPDRRRRDLLNYQKSLVDFLVPGILADDSLIHRAVLAWDDTVIGSLIEIEELPEQSQPKRKT